MSIPDFDRAEYIEPRVIEGHTGDVAPHSESDSFTQALLFGFAAAVAGSIGYALFSLTGFRVSIVAIGIGWLVAKAMMTGSGGAGGRPYQIAAVGLTYFAVTVGEVLHPLWKLHRMGAPAGRLLSPLIARYIFFGPLLEIRSGINGVLGLLILFFGLRAAWQMAAGARGFAVGGNRRRGPFEPR